MRGALLFVVPALLIAAALTACGLSQPSSSSSAVAHNTPTSAASEASAALAGAWANVNPAWANVAKASVVITFQRDGSLLQVRYQPGGPASWRGTWSSRSLGQIVCEAQNRSTGIGPIGRYCYAATPQTLALTLLAGDPFLTVRKGTVQFWRIKQ